MGSAERRARERTTTREKILAAARELFLRDGFEAVSMRKIAEAIEYTPPAIYTHFTDKQELLLALCEADFLLFRRALGKIADTRDPVERLRRMGRAYVKFALEHPHHYRLMFMTPLPAVDPGRGPIEHGNPDSDAYAFLRDAVRGCIEEGRFGPAYRDVESVTQVCWGAAHGVVSLAISHRHGTWVDLRAPGQTAELLLDACVDGMLAPAGPEKAGARRRRGSA